MPFSFALHKFHSPSPLFVKRSRYMLAFGAVEDENIASTWAYMKGRIAPLNDPVSNSELENRREGSWPPTPSPDAKDGMPCGTYVSQFAVQV